MVGFATNLGISNSLTAEVQGALNGLQMAWGMGIKCLHIELDSQIICDWLNKIEVPLGQFHGPIF